MSKTCNYVYVQGLRFDPKHVKVLWKDADNVERLVKLRKTGTGKALFDEFGIPVTLTPKDLKKLIRDGETITVTVRLGHHPGNPDGSWVRLELDPRKAEGRKGRKAFDPAAFSGLPPSTLRALALEQLKTAPYGVETRNEAVARMLWSIENLDDADIAKILQADVRLPDRLAGKQYSERIKYYAAALYAVPRRSSTNVELASLLLSDRVLIAALLADGKHQSLIRLLQLAPLASASLIDTAKPEENVLAMIEAEFGPVKWAEPNPHTAVSYSPQELAVLVNYKIGDVGPAGGTIVAIESGMYLEAAPTDIGRFGWEDARSKSRDCREGGYKDWYLPYREELNEMYENRTLIEKNSSGFMQDSYHSYWSSSEYDCGRFAWIQNFGSGNQGIANSNQSLTYYVRPVRNFSVIAATPQSEVS